MNVFVRNAVSHTPLWVFALLAYLVWIGAQRLRPSVRPLVRMWIAPTIFVIWGLVGLFSREGDFAAILTRWLVGALLGGALGSAGGMPLVVDRQRRLVRLPGSVLPLARVLVIFGAHYVLQAAAAMQPTNRAALLAWDVYVSGASTGYFVAWSLRFWRSYRKAPQTDLGPAAASVDA